MNPRNAIGTDLAASADLAAMDAILGELEISDEVELEAIEEIVEETEVVETAAPDEIGELIMGEDETRLLANDLARAETYAAEPVVGAIDTDASMTADPAAEPAVTTATPAAAKAPKKASAPRVARDLSSLPPEAFVLSIATPPADLAANKIEVIGLRPTQKKIADKFENLFLALHAGKLPSVYTALLFAELKAKGSVTSTDMVKVMMASTKSGKSDTYNEGTARSQVGQIMNLFSAVKIATRSGATLTFNPDSRLAAAMSALMTAPAAGGA